MSDRIGTHYVDCWKGGYRHYECAIAEIERLTRVIERALDYTGPKWPGKFEPAPSPSHQGETR